MIAMVVSDKSEKERKYIISFTRDLAGRRTEEYWSVTECATKKELETLVREKIKADILCIDITMEGALELVKEFRRFAPSAYLILIASPGISPVTYLRPAIGAESLMLKPLTKQQVDEVLGEALETYISRFYSPDEEKVFVIENKGGRELVSYQNICFFEAREKRVFLNTGPEEYGFYDTLDQLEERLSEQFLRCHRSYLVNKSKIVKVYLSQNRLLLEGELEIPVSRSYKPALKEYLGKGDR